MSDNVPFRAMGVGPEEVVFRQGADLVEEDEGLDAEVGDVVLVGEGKGHGGVGIQSLRAWGREPAWDLAQDQV